MNSLREFMGDRETVMRNVLSLAVAMPLATGSAAWAQSAPAATKCDNPNALGVSRVVEIATTGGTGFGFEHFKAYDFLTDKEVVLTFDDGPWPGNPPRVLLAFAVLCSLVLFFLFGLLAGW